MTDTRAITPSARELPPGAPFDAPGIARMLLRTTRAGALATIDPSGFPLSTLTTVATDMDGAPLLLLSGLSLHTRNLLADPRVSLLLAETGKGDPLAYPRLTLVGRATKTDDHEARRRFLMRHPKAELYASLPDFAMFRMEVGGVHLNGGFGRAAGLGPADILTEMSGAEALREAEGGAIAHLNADHADALQLYAHRLAKESGGTWRAATLDPDGLDLVSGDRTARVLFPQRVTGPGPLAKVLKLMAAEARG